MQKVINEKITVYSEGDTLGTVFVFSHGSSAGKSSEFITSVSSQLAKSNPSFAVVTYDFDFVITKKEPSKDLVSEVYDLEQVLRWVKNSVKPSNIVLIGKSFGGVINMKYLYESGDPEIKKNFVIGTPLKLGFPPRLHLLNEDNPTLPPYQEEYSEFFKTIKHSTVIVQGDSDDLCGIPELMECIGKNPKCEISVVLGANHGLKSVDGKTNYYSECVDIILKNI